MTYFWIITLQWTAGYGAVTRTASGTLTAQDGTTRTAVFEWVLSGARRAIGPEADAAVVLFLSIEPDALMPGTSPEPAHAGAMQ